MREDTLVNGERIEEGKGNFVAAPLKRTKRAWFRTGVRDDGGLGHILIGTNKTEKDMSSPFRERSGAVSYTHLTLPTNREV